MTQTDLFALKNSGLEPFLFAVVGDEQNGASLTVLSLLARLGFDPWVEAARWVTLPRNAAIACLAGSIARMPLPPNALAEAQAIATRLVLLLPANNSIPGRAARIVPPQLVSMPKWLPMTILYCALAIGMGLSVILAPRPDAAPAASNTLIDHQPRAASVE
jgi:hypothetical protein